MKSALRTDSNLDRLKGGEFYGRVPQQRRLSSSILSEVIHRELRIPKHFHANPYFTLVLAGGYSEELGNKTYLHKPMSLLWRREEVLHKEDRIGASGAHFFTIEVQPDELAELSQLGPIPGDFSEQNGTLVQHVSRLYHEFKHWQLGSEPIAEGIILEMLGLSWRRVIHPEKRSPVWLLRVVEKLNDEYTENISNRELAREAKVHPVHLAAVFRQVFHKTVSEYVHDLRINQATKLLGDRRLSLAEIGAMTGFADQSHFTRVFKRRVGVAPGSFRNSLH
jgi:AraC family transcriptional regulator